MQSLTIVQRETESLIPYAQNAKLHSKEQIAQIAGSIRAFGFNNPVLIDPDGTIIAGHGRVLGAQKLGLETVPCIVLAHLSADQRRAFRIADNRLAEIGGGWDEELLNLELKAIVEAGLAELTGFDDIEAMLADEADEEIEPDVPFARYIGESQNYIVLTFDNETDWLCAQDHFGIARARDTYDVGKSKRYGIGRVVDGGQYLTKIKNDA
jgi:hypothetical protein